MPPEVALYIAALLQLLGLTAAMYVVVSGLRDKDNLMTMLGVLIGTLVASGLFIGGAVVTLVYATYGILKLRRQKTQNHDRLEP